MAQVENNLTHRKEKQTDKSVSFRENATDLGSEGGSQQYAA